MEKVDNPQTLRENKTKHYYSLGILQQCVRLEVFNPLWKIDSPQTSSLKGSSELGAYILILLLTL